MRIVSEQERIKKYLRKNVLKASQRLPMENITVAIVEEFPLAGTRKQQTRVKYHLVHSVKQVVAEAVRSLKVPGYNYLQQIYMYDTVLVPLRLMTKEELEMKMNALRKMVKGDLAHIEELETWVGKMKA